jgi:uncharacterized protein
MKNYYDSGGHVELLEPGDLADDDLLAVLSTMGAGIADSVTGEAIGTESLRYGRRVSVMALPSPQIHRTSKGPRQAGPRAFGYDIPFKSVFVEEEAELVA